MKNNNNFKDKIVKGDTLRELKKIAPSSFDLVFADPPYNLQISKDLNRPDQSKVKGVKEDWDKFESLDDYDNFTFQWLKECKRILKDCGCIWTIGTYHNIFRIGKIMQDLGFWILNDIIWNKNNPMPNFKGTRFTNAHETLIWAVKKKNSKYKFNYQSMKCFNDDLQMRSDWKIPICSGSERLKKNGQKVHSTQKPEALLYRIILSSTSPGDKILDPFFGTGTTGAVAKKLGRNFMGIEKDENYLKISRERIGSIEKVDTNYLKTLENKRNKKRIPFGSLIENGILEPGTTIFDRNQKYYAKIMADGSIKCQNISGSIHRVAAEIQGFESCNGWTFWHLDLDGVKKPIDILRNGIKLN